MQTKHSNGCPTEMQGYSEEEFSHRLCEHGKTRSQDEVMKTIGICLASSFSSCIVCNKQQEPLETYTRRSGGCQNRGDCPLTRKEIHSAQHPLCLRVRLHRQWLSAPQALHLLHRQRSLTSQRTRTSRGSLCARARQRSSPQRAAKRFPTSTAVSGDVYLSSTRASSSTFESKPLDRLRRNIVSR